MSDTPDGDGKRLARSRVRRGGKVGGVVARHAGRGALNAAMAPLRGPERDAAARDKSLLKLADDIVMTAGGMRGAAQKLGQVIGVVGLGISDRETRAEFARRLAPLYNAVPRWDDAAMTEVLRRSLGARYPEIGELSEPMAAASIGQVYRARLRDGRDVAVKVKYPNIDQMVRADLKNLRMLSRSLAKYLPAANGAAIVEEVIRQITRELDFLGEMADQQAFAQRYAGHPAFVVPGVVPELCTDEVLVSQWLDAMPFDEACLLPQEQRDRIGETIYRFYCGEMYRIGKFVADPHPGNVLVLPDGRVGFVDYGLCIELSKAELVVERLVFSSLLRGEVDAAFRLAAEAGFVVDEERASAAGFADYIGDVVGWHLRDDSRRITSSVAARSAAAALMLQGEHAATMAGQALMEAHAFGRRNELATCALLGRLEASAPWSAIAREVLSMSGPATEMGEQIAQWHQGRDE
ncbi:AarF/ABC1/UbiB kinase family protein [Gordonia sp. X0973]|uniref:ABC1 kinase family protein n=1 Tax=Gordonia sp. X0973 TaxID=2742602 RepID=UPI000F54A775|nr:AarF/ABC1/UbiB kinase family protein [Gordonia sp. X0973]QKT06109.1 AarF/ABC1/UbiB kinase family protein [Gordonia sp. X0973]